MTGRKVRITTSVELREMRLHALVGRSGVIVARNDSGKGYFVLLDKPYQDEQEWYIPAVSIQTARR